MVTMIPYLFSGTLQGQTNKHMVLAQNRHRPMQQNRTEDSGITHTTTATWIFIKMPKTYIVEKDIANK